MPETIEPPATSQRDTPANRSSSVGSPNHDAVSGDSAHPLLVRRFTTDRPGDRTLQGRKRPLAFGVEPWRTHFPLRLARYPAMLEAISSFLNERGANAAAPVDLLDAGAGRGRSLRYAEPLGIDRSIRWHGVDLESHRAYAPERWSVLRDVDIEQGLPFEDASFDIVLCEQVLEHLHDPEAAFAELSRVLRPGGMLVAGVPTFIPPLASTRRLIFAGPARWFGLKTEHPQTFTAGSFVGFARRVGLRVHDVRGFRVVSGGLLRPLEQTIWWYRFNRRLGAVVPWLCVETQIVARKPV